MNDEWRTIPGFGGRYMINKDGDVVSVLSRFGDRETPKLMRKRVNERGVVVVDLLVGELNRRSNCRVMRLMAKAWIRDDLAKNEVAYPIDGDPLNTRLENVGIRLIHDEQKVAVLKVDSDGNVVKRYESILAAAEGEYVSLPCIRYHLYGGAKSLFEGKYRLVREDGAV